jgi:hypothetical protein
MSECQIKRNFCMTHKCWVSVQDDTACPMSVLAAQVERLQAANETLTLIAGQAGTGWRQDRARITAALNALDTSETDVAAELESQIRAALTGDTNV